MIRDRGQWAELAVLATVLAIAALASYIHLREVWLHAGAPVPALGPLLVDGLFAAAWLRMRRRRRQGDEVGGLAWLALGLALAMTLAGNVAAAWIAGHRDPLSLTVAGIPAAVFALVWELLTGHKRHPVATTVAPLADVVVDEYPELAPGLDMIGWPTASPLVATPAPAEVEVGGEVAPYGFGGTTETEEGWNAYAAHLIGKGFGRKRLARELDLTEHEARELLAKHRDRQGTPGEDVA